MVNHIEGLQLDLLTIVARLEQIRDECIDGAGDLTSLGYMLLLDRVIGCDLPRLRRHLTAEALAFEKECSHA